MPRLLRPLPFVLALAGVPALVPRPALPASKIVVAALGDPAPGGGAFAGPGFTGWPAAAGEGWIAFRSEITGGGTSEALVVAHVAAPATRAQVASLGQTAPAGEGFAGCAGTFKQFIGPPAMNANGDVAFLALLTPASDGAGDTPPDDLGPTPAGILLYRDRQLRALACSGQSTAAGKLDLTAVVDPFVDPTGQIAERAPALNDAGDAAFLAGFVDDDGAPTGGAIFLATRGGGLEAAIRLGDAFEGGEVLNLGPPALNDNRLLAFHAFATTTSPTDEDGVIDGIFLRPPGGSPSVLVPDGIAPAPLRQPLLEFADAVSLNDAGDVAFLAGPLFDFESDANPDDEGTPGVLLARGGDVRLVGYPGQIVGPDRVTGVALGPSAGGLVVPPAVTPDGRVVFLVELNGGSGEAIVRSEELLGEPLPLVYTGGAGASETPVGGTYGGAQSAPAADAVGGIVFRARVAGGATSEALVYRPPGGGGTSIVVGDAAPTSGFFAGRPFAPPVLNDAGDVVFRAFVARGPASVGIFHFRAGTLSALVRAGDASPTDGGEAFFDLAGQPSLNATGAVAFAATVPALGRGIYVAEGGSLRAIAVRDAPAPGVPGTVFAGLGANPTINDGGAVAFRGSTSHRDSLTSLVVKRDGIFVADATGIHAMVYGGEPSPSGLPFLKMRDVFLSNLPSVAFRASLGSFIEATTGLFLADALGATEVALDRGTIAEGVIVTGFSGNPAVSPAGLLAFGARRARQTEPGSVLYLPIGPAVLRRTPGGLAPVAEQGQAIPAGGRFRNLGQPSINDAGHVAFRASFEAFSGGTPGLYLAGDAGPAPYVLQRETTPLGGRFSSFGPRIALNAHDELAFTASVSRGSTRSGLFVAYPTTLGVRHLAIRLGRRARDRILIRAQLTPGRVHDGVNPAREPVTVSLGDASGPLWSATVPGRSLRRTSGAFVATPRRGGELGQLLRAVRVEVLRGGRARVTSLSAPVNLTRSGTRALEPPFTVGLQVGDDSGIATVDCPVDARGVRCGG